MTTENAEDADILAYKIVLSALTSATESFPTGMAMFNDKVLTTTSPINPRDALKKALKSQKNNNNPAANYITATNENKKNFSAEEAGKKTKC